MKKDEIIFGMNKDYKCLHDVIIDKSIAFKANNIYHCYMDNTILGEHGNTYPSSQIIEHISPYGYVTTIGYFELYTKETDKVNHPSHYTWLKDTCGIEVIDITRHLDFCLGNAVKYLLRAGHKAEEGYSNKDKTIEDLKKSIWYINDKIKQLEDIL